MPTPNQFKVVDDISTNILARLVNSLGLVHTANRDYDEAWSPSRGFKIGDTLRIQEPVYYTTSSGPALQLQAIEERQTYLTIAYQEHVDVAVSSVDYQRFLNDPESNIYEGAAQALANKIDRDGVLAGMNSIYRSIGTAGSGITSFGQIGQALGMQQKGAVVNSQYLMMNVDDSVSLRTALYNSFNVPFNTDISQRAVIGEISGLDCYVDQNLSLHNNGTFATSGTIEVNGAGQTGSTIDLKGFTASQTGVLNVGDTIKFQGVYAVNPVSKVQVGTGSANLASFIVTATANSDGAGLATVSIDPPIDISANYGNVTGSPADSADVTLNGGAGGEFTNNFVYSRDAFTFACVPPPIMLGAPFCKVYTDPDTGISLRVTLIYDPTVDKDIYRMDVFYGWKCFPQFATRLIG